MIKPQPKGPAMEESLRRYFLSLGYYVLRGVKFKYHEFDITDIDLWLYSKSSALARHRTNVDIKNKRTPQAIERIFWAKGLKEILGLDGCIVVTTDSRPDVREFGLSHQIPVLDGPFLTRLKGSSKTQIERLNEEDFLAIINDASLGRMGGGWKDRYEEAKSRVLTDLSFDGCNAYLNDIQYFLEQKVSLGSIEHIPLRLTYAIISMFLISLDFILKNHSSLDNEHKLKIISDGFRYGDSGKSYADRLTRLTAGLTEASNIAPGIGATILEELQRQAKAIPVEVLAEFFAKTPVQGQLFSIAQEYESAAFAVSMSMPSLLSRNAQATLGALTDFFSLDRKRIFN